MAASTPPPPRAPTAITSLSDDLLREIFLRLPSLPTLARAAFTCRAFLRAVRSSPAFRRRFRRLHAPPLLALFLTPHMRAAAAAAAGKSTDIAAAFDGLLQDSSSDDDQSDEWRAHPEAPYSSYTGFANFFSCRAGSGQSAHYSPHSQSLQIYRKNNLDVVNNNNGGHDDNNHTLLEFHTLFSDDIDIDGEHQQRVVCVHRDVAWSWSRVAVFSSRTMDWQHVVVDDDSPETTTSKRLPRSSGDRCAAGVVVAGAGLVCWVHRRQGRILALDTSTFEFSRMDLPEPMKTASELKFEFGQTQDGELCVVGVRQCWLGVWVWAAAAGDDDGGVERSFVLRETFWLRERVIEVTGCSGEAFVKMEPMVVVDGFVYLSVAVTSGGYSRDPKSPEWFLSFCLETAELDLLHKESQLLSSSSLHIRPYIMRRWPSSLIHGKDLETGVARSISKEDGPMGREEASPVLFTALQSFKQKLIDDGNSNFADIESFLLDDERDSLLNRIATLESRLATARDLVLRIGIKTDLMNPMELVTLELEVAAAKDRILNLLASMGCKKGAAGKCAS